MSKYRFRIGISVDVVVTGPAMERDMIRRFMVAVRPVIAQNFRDSDAVTGFIEHPDGDPSMVSRLEPAEIERYRTPRETPE